MNNVTSSLKTFGKTLKTFVKRHKSTILTITGLGLGAVTVVEAVKHTPAAAKDVADARRAKEANGEKFTKIDAVKAGAKHYILPAVTGAASVACIGVAHKMDLTTISDLTAMVKTSRDTIQAIKEAETEVVGEKKALAIQEKADEKLITDDDKKVLSMMPDGKCVLCKDYISGISFISDFETLEKAEAAMKVEQARYGSVDYSMFFEQVGIEAPPAIDGRFFNDEPKMVMRINRAESANEKTFVMIDWRDEPEYDPKDLH